MTGCWPMRLIREGSMSLMYDTSSSRMPGMYPSASTIAHFGIFTLGCIVGGTLSLVLFKDGIGGQWATIAGAVAHI